MQPEKSCAGGSTRVKGLALSWQFLSQNKPLIYQIQGSTVEHLTKLSAHIGSRKWFLDEVDIFA